MEQHMYTFLNQRYGLKSLIIEHASAVIKAVNKYHEIDNDVAVFGKILRNEVDEEFRFVQKQLKDTVVELLRVYLKGKMPMKTDIAINRILKKRLFGFVEEDEWVRHYQVHVQPRRRFEPNGACERRHPRLASAKGAEPNQK